MEEKERELWVGENRVYLREDNIISLDIVGELDEDKAKELCAASLNFMNMVEGKVHTLVNNNKAGKQTAQARKIFSEFVKHDRYGKCAIFGAHPVARVIASFFIGVAGVKDNRFFKSKEEALTWLKE